MKFESLLSNVKKETDSICGFYYYQKTLNQIITYSVSILVQIVNYLIRLLVVGLVDFVRYREVSENASVIMQVSFVVSFINTGIIPLLTNANLAYAPIIFSWIPLRQQYSDFNSPWYIAAGPQIVITMVTQSIMPYVSIAISIGLANLNRWLDSGFPCCKRTQEF